LGGEHLTGLGYTFGVEAMVAAPESGYPILLVPVLSNLRRLLCLGQFTRGQDTRGEGIGIHVGILPPAPRVPTQHKAPFIAAVDILYSNVFSYSCGRHSNLTSGIVIVV